jgi:heme-degrading monooxygenase HmoA
MFIRFLEFTVKPGKKVELIKKIKEEILPVLKKYNGFFDLLPWEVETEPAKYFAVSLWYEKKDAERYEKEYFAKVKQIVEPFLTTPVIVKFGPVETTIPEKLFVGTTV